MASLCLSSPSVLSLRLRNRNNRPVLSLTSRLRSPEASVLRCGSSSACFNPLRVSVDCLRMATMRVEKRGRRGSSVVCYAAPLSPRNLQWISTFSSIVLMLSKGTGIQKSFLVPLFALQAPANIISWMKGEYGIWAAFMALLVRLFFFIPGELELPFVALLLVIVAPYQVMNLRGKQEGVIIALAIAGFLAFQHFSRAGSLQKAFDQGSILATLGIICVTVVSFLFLM
ncbi:PREDICTED: cold-regulated 413 inner membrane protein 1, chloroplastic-like [Tarenaya hassleriana]|uniref:cold-regulated 413 inner membrane protein 1, chloroplastic-like n=1 Tax=Tarenaya hassleriana TaxID=28532 RepID=UPI00053C834C|nr:PREDICTED: cold-regulated 413 inner membrane protein 1, chloroplastic-like [Tarenaya hassleriana]